MGVDPNGDFFLLREDGDSCFGIEGMKKVSAVLNEGVKVAFAIVGKRLVIWGWWRWLALLGVLAIAVGAYLVGSRMASLRNLGYLGVAVITFTSSASIILPVPGFAAVYAGGGLLNPYLVGLIAGLGEALGELTGYLAGFAMGKGVMENRPGFQRLEGWVRRGGWVVVFLASSVPNPLFDIIGVASGGLGLPVTRFFLACWAGKTLKALAVALLGAWSLDMLLQLAGRFWG